MPATRGNGYYTSLATCLTRQISDIWLCIGQEDEWPGGIMPSEDPSTVPNPILYKKVSICALAKQVTETDPYDYHWISLVNGEVVNRYFKTIDETEAIENNNRIFYIRGQIVPNDGGIEEISYRAVGFYQGLTPATGHENDTILLPDDVENPGNLLVVQHIENPTYISGENTASPQIAIQVGG